MKFTSLIAVCGGLQMSLAATSLASAQTPAAVNVLPGAGQALQGANEARQAAPQPTTGALVLPQLNEPLFTLKDKSTLLVRHFELQGENPIAEADVREILAPYENRKLTLAEIYAAADKVSTLLRNNGYQFAKAYVPAQDARGGTLRIKLVPGKYGTITVKNESLVRDDYLRGIIDYAIGGSPYVHNRELERAMLLIADLAGSGTPHITVGAGQQPETSDFLFNVPEGHRVNGYLLADNYGPGFYGRDRLTGGVDVNSPLGYGDKLSGFGMVSQQTMQVNGRVSYAFPLGYDGLHAEIAGFRTIYSLGGIFKDVDVTGFVNGVTGSLTYAVTRSRDSNIYISGSFTHEGLDDKASGTSFRNRTIDLGTASITRDTIGVLPFFDLPMTTSATFSITSGYVNYVYPDQKALDAAGPNIQGNYVRINLSADTTIALNEKWSVSARFKAQKSLSGTLDSSEQMLMTGFSGVRSYDEGLTADSGVIFTPELKYALPDVFGYRHALGLFTDIGADWLEKTLDPDLQRSYTPLYDVGLGYHGTYEYSPGRALMVNALVAHTYGPGISSYDSTTYDRHTRGMVQLGVTF